MAKKAKTKVVVVAEKTEKTREPNDGMRGRIVTAGVPLWQQSNRKRHLQFKAGKMYVIDNMVHPDPRKGYICIDQDEEHVMHFCWMERDALGTKEDDFTPEPYDSIFKKIPKCTTGRVYLLKLRSTNKNHFYWMQESSAEKDSEISAKVNYLLNFPPVWLRFPQIAWNCEMAHPDQSSEYNSAESDANEPEGPEDSEMGAKANIQAVSRMLREVLSSLSQEYVSRTPSKPHASKDPFPQPIVGNVNLMAIQDLLPVLGGGMSQSENSVGSTVKGKAKALTAFGNGGLMGFIDGDVSDLESDSDYLDVVDAPDLEREDSERREQRFVHELPRNCPPGPLRLRGPPELGKPQSCAGPGGIIGVECLRVSSNAVVKPGTLPADVQIQVLTAPNGNYREASSEFEVSTAELNHHQGSDTEALEKWESVTDSTPVPQDENRVSNVSWKEPWLLRKKSEEQDDEFDPVMEGWQTARSSTVDTSFVDSEVSSREFNLSDMFSGSGGSTWRSATDGTEAVVSTAADNGKATVREESKMNPLNELAVHDGASNGGGAHVVALRVDLGDEAKLESHLEVHNLALIKGRKNEVEPRDEATEASQALPSSQLRWQRLSDGDEVQDINDESGTKEPSTLPRSDNPGKYVNSVPQSRDHRSSVQSVPITSKHLPASLLSCGPAVPQQTESVEAVPSSSTRKGQDGVGGVGNGKGTDQVSGSPVQERLGDELFQDGFPCAGPSAGRIAMMVLSSSLGSDTNSGVGKEQASQKIDEDRQSLHGAVNRAEECGLDHGNQATTCEPSSCHKSGTSRSWKQPEDRPDDDVSDTQVATMGEVCAREDLGMKAGSSVSKSLEEVSYVRGPFTEPRYNLRKRPQAARPSQSGPMLFGCNEGRMDGQRKKPRTSSPGVPLPAPFRVQDASPARTRHPRLSSARLVSSPNQGERGSGGRRKRANNEEPLEAEVEEPPKKKARTSEGNSSTQSASSNRLNSAGGSRRTPSGLSGRNAKTDGQQTEPVKIREIKKAGAETKVRTRVTPQAPPQPGNRTCRDRSQNTKPVIVEDTNGSNPKPKERKPDRNPKP